MQVKFCVSLAVLLLVVGRLSAADDKNPAYTNAAEAGPDFAFQGEYLGSLGEHKWGVQVVALGDGKFDIVGYRDGLPGDGWKRGDETRRGTGELQDGVAHVKGDTWIATIKDGVFTILHGADKIGELKKVERRSPTLGAKPPAGAKILFDGTTADNFEGGQIVEGNLLGASSCVSKLKLGDHSLHIEFRTPFMPKSRGQARGNSGVYAQGRYEVQVLDSFGLEGKNNECGGIYSMAEPAVNMCFPPLSWQTYDIDFKAAKYDESGKKVENARITIKHNGVLIHDNLELKQGTPGYKPEGPDKLGLFLQNHGNPVTFRNIWVMEK
jgi:3-keto-disaccharide hydrolase